MKKYSIETAVGIFIFICLICVGYLTIKLGNVQILGQEHYPIQARFNSVSGLREGSSVQIAGVSVGWVESISLGDNLQAAHVELRVREDIKLTDDTFASIKTSGLIGDKYISLSPGGSGIFLQPGEMIIDTESPLDLQELISKYAFGEVKDEKSE
jgi:phospholipid/cholesterol/gamma-HCH transport system substrate-binding protein